MIDTTTQPLLPLLPQQPPLPARPHLVARTGLTRAYVLGPAVMAVCRRRFLPSRDPDVCRCARIARTGGSGECSSEH